MKVLRALGVLAAAAGLSSAAHAQTPQMPAKTTPQAVPPSKVTPAAQAPSKVMPTPVAPSKQTPTAVPQTPSKVTPAPQGPTAAPQAPSKVIPTAQAPSKVTPAPQGTPTMPAKTTPQAVPPRRASERGPRGRSQAKIPGSRPGIFVSSGLFMRRWPLADGGVIG